MCGLLAKQKQSHKEILPAVPGMVNRCVYVFIVNAYWHRDKSLKMFSRRRDVSSAIPVIHSTGTKKKFSERKRDRERGGKARSYSKLIQNAFGTSVRVHDFSNAKK